MEKRVTTLEVIAEQNAQSIGRLDQSIASLRSDLRADIADLRKNFDRKFILCLSLQFTALVAMIGLLSKMANIF